MEVSSAEGQLISNRIDTITIGFEAEQSASFFILSGGCMAKKTYLLLDGYICLFETVLLLQDVFLCLLDTFLHFINPYNCTVKCFF